MIKFIKNKKAQKIRLFQDSTLLKFANKNAESIENKGFYRTRAKFATEHITEVNIYDDGLL